MPRSCSRRFYWLTLIVPLFLPSILLVHLHVGRSIPQTIPTHVSIELSSGAKDLSTRPRTDNQPGEKRMRMSRSMAAAQDSFMLLHNHMNPLRTQYRHQPLCGASVDLLFLVTSAPSHFQERRAVRNTWGSLATSGKKWPGDRPVEGSIRVVFMLGASNYDSKAVDKEANRHGDMLVGDYVDTYRNLSLKTLLGFGWACRHCPARFLVKTDDDIFVNIPMVMSQMMARGEQLRYQIAGTVLRAIDVQREGKWHINESQFPFSRYPDYVAGHAYATSHSASCRLFDMAHHVRLIPVEDVLITGFIARRFLKMKLHHDFGWTQSMYPRRQKVALWRQCFRFLNMKAFCTRQMSRYKTVKADFRLKFEIWNNLNGIFNSTWDDIEAKADKSDENQRNILV